MSVTISDKSFGTGRRVIWFFDFLFDPFFLGFRLSLCCSQRRLGGPTWFSKGIHWRSMWRAAPPFVGKGFHWFLGSFFSTKKGTRAPLMLEQKGQIVQKLFQTRNILAPHEDTERSLFGAQRENVGIDFDKCRRETQEVRLNWLRWQHLKIKWLNSLTYCKSFEIFLTDLTHLPAKRTVRVNQKLLAPFGLAWLIVLAMYVSIVWCKSSTKS